MAKAETEKKRNEKPITVVRAQLSDKKRMDFSWKVIKTFPKALGIPAR